MSEISEFGVVTGVDEQHAWMLPWWLENLRRYNPDLPVAIANFGSISDEVVEWIKDNSDQYIDLTKPYMIAPGVSSINWFKKPAAITNSRFKKVLWLDSDCQVQGNLMPIFNQCNHEHVGLTWDYAGGFNRGFDGKALQKAAAAGVVATFPRNELMLEWEDYCRRAKNMRGDQEVLNWLLDRRRVKGIMNVKIKIMPKEYQWLRLWGYNPKALVMHWTGIEGKREISKQMGIKPTYWRSY